MKTAIAGKVRLKWFWRGLYSGSGMTPIQRIFRLGNLSLAKVVYSKHDPFNSRYYKTEVLDLLQKHYDVVWEKMPCGESNSMWHYVYSKIDGGQVGRPEEAYKLLQQGIKGVQKAYPNDKVCSIGYIDGATAEEQKWVGWSHRAMCSWRRNVLQAKTPTHWSIL